MQRPDAQEKTGDYAEVLEHLCLITVTPPQRGAPYHRMAASHLGAGGGPLLISPKALDRTPNGSGPEQSEPQD